MKKTVLLLAFIVLLFCSACGNSADLKDTQINDTDDISMSENQEQENSEETPIHRYVGEYSQEPVYQKIVEIETCTDPDALCLLLMEVYGEEFDYIKMEYKGTNSSEESDKWFGYEEPYEDFLCAVGPLYNADLYRGPLSSDTYVFFKPYNETPSFVMDCDGTYIVSSHEIKEAGHYVSGWIISDLFLCLHEYVDEDAEQKAFLRDAVRYIDCYMEFENLIIDSLGEDTVANTSLA